MTTTEALPGAADKDEKERVLSARVSPQLHREVRIRAIEEDRSVARLVEDALRQYLGRMRAA